MKAITTKFELNYPEATDVIYAKEGIRLMKIPKMSVDEKEEGETIAFLPYENLIALQLISEEE